jgi:hypothetical protein
MYFEESSIKKYFGSWDRRHSCLCAMNHPCASSSGRNLSHFVYVCLKLMFCDLRLTLGPAPLCSLILVCAWQHLNAIGHKKSLYTWDSRKSSGQAHLFNIWTIGAMNRISTQPQVKLSLLRINPLKFPPANRKLCKGNTPTTTFADISRYIMDPLSLVPPNQPFYFHIMN